MRGKKGFTLIELLVVIAIIGILAAILLPTMHIVKEKALQSRCINNLMQMGRMYKVYQTEQGGEIFFPQKNGSEFVLALYKEKFLIESQIFLCPGTQDSNGLGAEIEDVVEGDSDNACSYAGRKNEDQSSYPGFFKLTGEITSTPMVMDDVDQGPDKHNHGKVSNFLMLDLHVESQPNRDQIVFGDLFDPMSN